MEHILTNKDFIAIVYLHNGISVWERFSGLIQEGFPISTFFFKYFFSYPDRLGIYIYSLLHVLYYGWYTLIHVPVPCYVIEYAKTLMSVMSESKKKFVSRGSHRIFFNLSP